MAKFVIKQATSRGVSHPVVARLSVQMSDTIGFSKIPKDRKDVILKACLGPLQSRLGKCWDICDHVLCEIVRCDKEYERSDSTVVSIPQVQGLDRDVDNFLYEAKNFLRDLVNLTLKQFHKDIKFSDASALCDQKRKGESDIVKWARNKFGDDDHIVKMLRDDQPWIEELIRKRNAVEHPGKLSGTLIVQNVEVMSDGMLVPPVWMRTGTNATSVYDDMVSYCQNLLSFSEELIIFAGIERTCISPAITFAEIPEDQRSADSPIRFRAVFKSGTTPQKQL